MRCVSQARRKVSKLHVAKKSETCLWLVAAREREWGNVAGFRNAFQRARNYLHSQEAYERDLKAWKDAKEKTPTMMRMP